MTHLRQRMLEELQRRNGTVNLTRSGQNTGEARQHYAVVTAVHTAKDRARSIR